MAITCINCGEAELVNKQVQLTGPVRGETYTASMKGWECPRCGYVTIDGDDMPEFGKLLADEYRAHHGLLTSLQIRERRKALGMSQDAFSQHLGVGIASVKRWEMGKIQDERSNQLIIDKTEYTRVPIQVVGAGTYTSMGCATFNTGFTASGRSYFKEVCISEKHPPRCRKEMDLILKVAKVNDEFLNKYAERPSAIDGWGDTSLEYPFIYQLLNEERKKNVGRR